MKLKHKMHKHNDRDLLEHIGQYFDQNGFYETSTIDLRKHLLTKLPSQKVPSLTTLRRVLKEHFKLKYGRLDKINLKYRDPTYNEKRLWVARLIAQFLFEDAVVISVDESNFKHDSLPTKQWQFNRQVIYRDPDVDTEQPKRLKRSRPQNVLFATDRDLEYAEYLEKLRLGSGELGFRNRTVVELLGSELEVR